VHKHFVSWLIVPLATLSVVCFVLHFQLNWDGLFLNLATELLGIIVTLAYVDYILKRLDKQRWRAPHSRVASRLRRFANRSINHCLQSLRYQYETFDGSKIVELSDDEREVGIYAETVRVAREILMIDVFIKIDAFDVEDWGNFGAHMQSVDLSAERLLLAFGDRLSPDQYTLLLDIQEIAEGTRFTWSTVPQITAGPDQLVIRRELIERTILDLRVLLQKLEEMHATAA